MNFARCLAQRGPSLAQRLLRTPSHYGRGFMPKTYLRPALSSGFRFGARPSSTSSAEYRLAEEGIDAHLDQDQIKKVVEYAKSIWPTPPSIPNGWSSDWEQWPYLLTFYWSSPYFLMIPQIEMIVNILYRLRGETRPLFFSNSQSQFIFTLCDEPTRFFLYDVDKQSLFEFYNVASEEDLVQKVDRHSGDLPLAVLTPDAEGESAIQRILQRDETVVPLLAEQFLDYTPGVTEPWQENPLEQEMVTEEDKEEFRKLIQEKVDQAMEGRKADLTEEERWEVIKGVATELDRRDSEVGKDGTG